MGEPTGDVEKPDEMTRRECITLLGAGAAGVVLGPPAEAATAAAHTVTVGLRVNGAAHRMTLDPRVTLLDLLREHLHLTGTKKGCDHGQCGACTVLVNGRRINSCLSLAACHDGDEVRTVEGLGQAGALDALQAAFIEQDGFQCGYCTSGQICSATALISEAQNGEASFVTADLRQLGPADLTDAEIRERMSGNLCRCGAYPGIVAAVRTLSSHGEASRSKEGQR